MSVALTRGACGLPLPVLLLKMVFRRLKAVGGEGDAAFGGPGLGGQCGESARAGALQGASDGGRALFEVFPAEA